MDEARLRETDVMERLDVSQKRLRALRREHLSEGPMHGRDAAGYWFTHEALAKLEAAVRVGQEPVLPMNGHAAEPEVLNEDLRVTRQWEERRKMVLCERPNGLEVVCQVQDAKFLRPGMMLRGCRRGMFKIWYYTGGLPKRVRDPRFPLKR